MTDKIELATLGGGCFWCLEAFFSRIEGVVTVESGYSGGSIPNPTYEQVCSGTTAHAEVVQISFMSHVISYDSLLQIFFTMHDPTTRNRQGGDVGTQYRSIVLYHSPEQEAAAKRVAKEVEASGIWSGTLVTEIVPFSIFFRAEAYHQDFYKNHPDQPYCMAVIEPKMRKLQEYFSEHLKKNQ